VAALLHPMETGHARAPGTSTLELLPPLAKLCPPATVIDKTRYSAFAEPHLLSLTSAREKPTASLSADRKRTSAYLPPSSEQLISISGHRRPGWDLQLF